MDWKQIKQALAAPFHPDELEFRVGNVAKSGKSASILTYLTSRAVMDRLDEVVGPNNWRDEYREGPGGGLLCGLSIRVEEGEAYDDPWVTKWDGAENTQVEAVKGGLSGAFKRAGVKWGIGRYLYWLDGSFQPIQQGWAKGHYEVNVSARGSGHLGKVQVPRLPAWAEPGGSGRPSPGFAAGKVEPDLEQRRRAVDEPVEKVKRGEGWVAKPKVNDAPAKKSDTQPKMAGTKYPFNTLDEGEARDYRAWDAADKHSGWDSIKMDFFHALACHGLKYDRPPAPGQDSFKLFAFRSGWPKPSSLAPNRVSNLMAGISAGNIKPPGWKQYTEPPKRTPKVPKDLPPVAPVDDLGAAPF